jgi:hypothetical protein
MPGGEIMRRIPNIDKDDFNELAGKYEFDAGMGHDEAEKRALAELAKQEREKTVPFPGAEIRGQQEDTRVVLAYNRIPDLHERSAMCKRALIDRVAPLYSKDGMLVCVRGETGEKKIIIPDVFYLRHETSKAVKYVKIKNRDNGGVEAVPMLAPPLEDVRDVLASSSEAFPKIRGIVFHPIFTLSGKIVSTPGYNAETGFYIDAEADLLNDAGAVPEAPDRADVREAVEVFHDILDDFPSANRASFANVVGMLLTILLRNIIPDITPIFLVKAAAAGTGKTLETKIVILAITGRPAALSTLPDSEEELSKVLLSVVLEGGGYFILDNVNRRLNSGTLAAVVTSGVLRGRILGKSEMMTVTARTPIVITANNPDMSRELARRCVTIELSCDLENPAQRTGFKHPDIERYVLQNRARILRAAFTLARAWFTAGKPAGEKSMGSFEVWDRIIGGILANAGISGFLENAEEFFQVSDSDSEDFRGFLEEWYLKYGENPVPVTDILPLARAAGLMDERKSEGSQKRTLGKLLGRKENTVLAGLKVVRGHREPHSRYWILKKTDSEGGDLS